jgi:hypothetical protein
MAQNFFPDPTYSAMREPGCGVAEFTADLG